MKIPGNDKKQIDIIVPVLNEEEAVSAFHQQLSQAVDGLPQQVRIIYVNDGSTDDTMQRLEDIARADGRVTVLELSRNFGHQAALTAGMDAARGDYVVTLDGDGQHPPTLIPEMLKLAESGYDVVLTQRIGQEDIPRFKRWTADFFYWLTNRIGDTHIPPDAADFRLLSRSAIQALQGMREYHRFLRGMVSWMGYRTVILPYTPPERLAGKSKYSLGKMLRLAMDAIFSFSLVPLYAAISIGVLFFILAAVEAVYVLSFWIGGRSGALAPGWSSLMFMLLIVGGSLMVGMGVIGIYVGYIFQEVKHRPVYILRRSVPGQDREDVESREGNA